MSVMETVAHDPEVLGRPPIPERDAHQNFMATYKHPPHVRIEEAGLTVGVELRAFVESELEVEHLKDGNCFPFAPLAGLNLHTRERVLVEAQRSTFIVVIAKKTRWFRVQWFGDAQMFRVVALHHTPATR